MGGDLIQTPQTRWIRGGYEVVPGRNLITLVGTLTGIAFTQVYSGLIKTRTTATYQVSAGRTLHITEIQAVSDGASDGIDIADGLNDVGVNSPVAPADVIQVSNPGSIGGITFRNPSANVLYRMPTHLTIPSGRFVYVTKYGLVATLRFVILGHEE